MSDSSLREVVRAAVASASPDELHDFDEIAAAIAAAPRQARRALRGRDVPNASAGWTGVAGVILAYLLLVGEDLAKDLAKDAIRSGARSAGRSMWRRFGRRQLDLDAELPPLTAAQRVVVRQRAEQAIVDLGGDPELAGRAATALVEQWPHQS